MKFGKRLGRRFFRTDAESLAAALLGQRLVRVMPDGRRLAGVIVETEGYLGVEDRGAHSFGGRRTPRNEAMYAHAGTAYVYFTYGMHHCVNVVAGEIGEPAAVLLRAIEPTEGINLMRQHRTAHNRSGSIRDLDLCRGPGRLCQAMQIDRSLNGVDLTADASLFIEAAGPIGPMEVARGPRIGLGDVGEWAAAPLRFLVRGNRYVSGRRIQPE